jgi:hypothetical protein
LRSRNVSIRSQEEAREFGFAENDLLDASKVPKVSGGVSSDGGAETNFVEGDTRAVSSEREDVIRIINGVAGFDNVDLSELVDDVATDVEVLVGLTVAIQVDFSFTLDVRNINRGQSVRDERGGELAGLDGLDVQVVVVTIGCWYTQHSGASGDGVWDVSIGTFS